MEKINAFIITKLTVSGFKCFGEPKEFDFGKFTVITGHNGKGKSSIADAIAYVITGTPYYGDGRLDRLYSVGGENAIRAELTIELPDGSVRRIARERVKDRTEITCDGLPIRQTDLTAAFGEKDEFLSIFNPLYFTESLRENGRSLLERRLPPTPHGKIIERLCDADRALLANERMTSPEGLLKSLRDEAKELEKDIVYTEGQRDLLGTQASEADAALSKKRVEFSDTENRIAELENKKTEGLDTAGMKERLADLYARYDEITKKTSAPAGTAEIDAELLAVSKKLAERKAELYVSKYAKEIADTEARFDAAKKRYKDENAALARIAPGIVCPVCKQAVTEENIGAVRESFGESINALIAEGNALKDEITELKDLDLKAASVFEDFRLDDTEKLTAEAAELEKKRDIILIEAEDDAQRRISRMDDLKGEILSLESDIETGRLTEDESAELSALQGAKIRLAAEIGVMEAPAGNDRAGRKEKSIEDMCRFSFCISSFPVLNFKLNNMRRKRIPG